LKVVTLLIDVYSPGNGKTYEFQLDGSMTAGQAKAGIISGILESENAAAAFDADTAMLCDVSSERRLPDNVTLRDAGVKSGGRLIIM
jgi:phosphoribosylanthranilate isomerase